MDCKASRLLRTPARVAGRGTLLTSAVGQDGDR